MTGMPAYVPIHDATQEYIKVMIRDAFLNSVPRWMKNIWLAQRSAKLVISISKENGVLWGRVASLCDELRFTKMELDEMGEYNKLDRFHLAEHYTAEATQSLEYEHITVDLKSYRQHYDLISLGFKGAPDYLARKLAEDTGRAWMTEIYPKIADAMGVKDAKRRPKRLDMQPLEHKVSMEGWNYRIGGAGT